MRRQRSTGVQYGNGLVRLGQRGDFTSFIVFLRPRILRIIFILLCPAAFRQMLHRRDAGTGRRPSVLRSDVSYLLVQRSVDDPPNMCHTQIRSGI